MEDKIQVKKFPSLEEANLAVQVLEAKGLSSVITPENDGLSFAVLVQAQNLEEATRILAEGSEPSTEGSPNAAPLLGNPVAEGPTTFEDPEDETMFAEVLKVLANPASEKGKGLISKLGLLAVTVALFAAFGFIGSSLAEIVILVAVIFVHEVGHFAGMKVLKYRDIKMFFIPFIGAAVSGKDPAPNAIKEALVLLMGPVPGIILGILTGFAYLLTLHPLLLNATQILLFLNFFNLLPFHPLDGGQLFNTLLLSHHPRLGTAFKTVTVLLLGAFCVAMESYFLAVFALFSLFSIPRAYAYAKATRYFRTFLPDPGSDTPTTIPPEYLRRIFSYLKASASIENWRPDSVATAAQNLWRIVRYRTCPWGITAGFLMLQFVIMALAAVSFIIFMMPDVLAKKG